MPGSMVVLGLAWFALVNAGASAIAWGAGRLVLRFGGRDRDDLVLTCRLVPAAASVIFVLAMFVPAHWQLEPSDARESFGLVLFALATTGAILIIRSAARVFKVARAGQQLSAWGRPSAAHPGGAVGICELPGFPGIALAGVLQPRILIGSAVVRELSTGELEVAVAHEIAHRAASDNLKQLAILCAPDFFGASRVARRLEERWRAASESAADARAVNGDPRRAVDLASALVKVAILGDSSSMPGMSPAWSSLNDPLLLETRVRRLVTGEVPLGSTPSPVQCTLGIVVLTIGLVVGSGLFAHSIHQVTEALVQYLP